MNALSSHPASLDLEAFACGDAVAAVGEHLGACGECRAFVAKIRAASEAFLGATPIDAIILAAEKLAGASDRIAKGEARVVELEARRARKTGLDWRVAALPVIAAAAGVLLWWRLGGEPPGKPEASGPVAMTAMTEAPVSTADPETSFKGGVQIAVIRERAGDQQRFTTDLAVQGGDRLRIEVALDRPQTILAGVLAEDGTWLDLMSEGTRGAGTHFSEQAARFDADPMRGWILVGTPDAIAQSRAARAPRGGVVAMRLGWEGGR
jgi:hypothetical protein